MKKSLQSICYAPDAFKLLRGVFCVYKPPQLSHVAMRDRIIGNLCRDLNLMKPRPPEKYVEIREDCLSDTGLTVVNVPSVADNPLVAGPRYQMQDFRLSSASLQGFNTSGLCVVGLNCAPRISELREARHLTVYQLCGKLGRATESFFEGGKVIEKSTFDHVSKQKIDKVVSAVQATHQKQMFHYMGVNIQSQAAYEIASQGLFRPSIKSPPLIYGLRCTYYNPPDFILEVQCINEKESYLLELVNNVGLDLKTNANCNKIRRIRYGNFTLEHALLRKHWTVEHIINNITACQEFSKMNKIKPVTANILENPFETYDQPLKIDER